MEHRIEHDLSADKARSMLHRAVESYCERFGKYNPEAQWLNDDEVRVGFNAKGAKLSGLLRLVPRAVVIDMEVPMLLRPFKGKAIGVIEAQVQKWVQRAHAGEL